MANVAKKAMSDRYGGNETLVSTSHSDMSRSRDSFDKEQYEKFLQNVQLQFLRQAI